MLRDYKGTEEFFWRWLLCSYDGISVSNSR